MSSQVKPKDVARARVDAHPGSRPTRVQAAVVSAIVAACLVAALPARAQDAGPDKARPFSLTPTAYGQFDYRWYPDWDVTPGTGRLNREAFEVRRIRVGLDGRWKGLSFEVTVDPQDGDAGDGNELLKDAWVQWRLAEALRIRIGQFKIPGSREYLVSSRDLDLMERSALVSSLAADRDRGVMISGRIHKRLTYQAGAFQGDGFGRSNRAGVTSAGRVAWEIRKGLEIAASFSVAETTAVDIDPANGLEGRAASGYRFFKKLYVDGRRTRMGADAEWEHGPWRLTVEGQLASETRNAQGDDYEDLPLAVGTGVSVTGVRRFGGHAKTGRPWDVVLRYEFLGFDDGGAATESSSTRSRAADVRPRSVHAVTGGLSWRPWPVVRVLGIGGAEFYAGGRAAPDEGRSGPYYTLATRLQLELPRMRWPRR